MSLWILPGVLLTVASLLALKTVFRQPLYCAIGVGSFLLFLMLYFVTLPSLYTGGRVGFIALQYLTAELAIWSVVMASLVAIITAFIVFLLRRGIAVSKASTVGGLVGGVIGPLLCCSPVLPITLGFIAGIFPALIGPTAWGLQGFIATHQTELFSAATLMLIFALWQNARLVEAGPSCSVSAREDTLS